jgi:hypothetical protein
MWYCGVSKSKVRLPSIAVKYYVYVWMKGECIAVGEHVDLLILVELNVVHTCWKLGKKIIFRDFARRFKICQVPCERSVVHQFKDKGQASKATWEGDSVAESTR